MTAPRLATVRVGSILALVAFAAPLAAQLEVAAAERHRQFEQIEALDEPIERVVMPEQRLVAWLPSGFLLLSKDDSARMYVAVAPVSWALFSRIEVEPGLGLAHAWELTADQFRDSGRLKQVDSVRQLEVAGRPALEVVATIQFRGADRPARLLVSLDPEQPQLRMLIVYASDDEGDRIDPLFKGLLRDWTPLDQGLWDPGFERLRSATIGAGEADAEALPWTERNRLLAALAEPAGVSQPWLAERLRALADERPALLLDGLLHHHPRVRLASLEALAAAAAPSTRRAALALALRDGDAIVRFTSARLAATDFDLAAGVLRDVLAVDQEPARSGAFQLLAVLDPESRRRLTSDAFDDRDQYPARSQALLAGLLGEWGPEAAAGDLVSAWKRATSDELRNAALGALARRDHPEVLVHARRRLADPARQDPLSVDDAVLRLIAASETGEDVEALEELAGGLESAAGDGGGNRGASQRDGWTRAAAQLRGFAEHLRGLPSGIDAEAECRRLAELPAGGSEPLWAKRRSAGLGCAADEEPAAGVRYLRVELPQPGSLLLSLRDLLDRLQLGSQEWDRQYRTLVEQLFESLDDSLVDPISAESTGIDPTAAWRWQGWTSAETGNDLADFDFDTAVTVECTDCDLLLHQMVRAEANGIPFEDLLREGLLLSPLLPLLPAVLTATWAEQRQFRLGHGEDGAEDAEAAEIHFALTSGDLWELQRLELYRRRPPAWSTVLTARIEGWRLTLLPSKHPTAGGWEDAGTEALSDPQETAGAGGEVMLDIDLATLLEDAPADDEPWVERLIEAGLRLEAAFGFDGSELSTTFSLSGFPDGWLDVARNLSLGELRAPAELLPADTLIWIAASLDRERFSGLLRAEPEIASELLGGADAEVVEELAMAVGSEVGVAVIGLPEPREAAADAWLDRLVFYLRVEPKAAKRFLRRAMDGSRSAPGGATVYHRGELHAVHVGEYLALATDDGVLGELGREPGLDTTAFYGEVVTRSPAEVTVVGGLHVDLFARRLLDLLPADSEHGGSRLTIEALRALGPIVVWSGRRGERLEGRISLRPDLHTEAAREQVRRLVGYVGYLAGSIPLDGFRSELETDSVEQLELEIELADADWPLTAADRDDGAGRLRLTRSAPGRYELISTAAAALPERSGLVLPIEASHLAPYLRPERGLGVRERQIEDLAAEIRGDAQDPAEIIRRILEWVAENLEYQPVSGTESNEETLTSRQADCTEFTALTVALCRSLGIPARTVHGAGLLPDGSVAILHRWAEVYLDRWYEIDPTAGQARVPASTLRLASSDATALVSTPGSRLRLQALRSVDGGLARRLAEVPGADHRGRVEIAVDGDDVLIAYADPPLESTASGLRVLRSADRGERFAAIATATPSELGELIGGHGKLLWLAGDGDRETRLYSLDESGGWEDLTAGIRQQLRRGLEVEPHRWSMAALDDGFLVLAHGGQPRAALLGPDLGFQRQLPHPPGVDEPWVLGPDRPVVAHRTADGGVALSEWDDGAWTIRVVFSDARGLEPRRLRTAGPRIELVCHDPGRDRQTLLWWSADTGKHNRTTPKEGVPIHDSVTVGSWIWDAWRDGGALIFSRRPSARASLGPAGALLD